MSLSNVNQTDASFLRKDLLRSLVVALVLIVALLTVYYYTAGRF